MVINFQCTQNIYSEMAAVLHGTSNLTANSTVDYYIKKLLDDCILYTCNEEHKKQNKNNICFIN